MQRKTKEKLSVKCKRKKGTIEEEEKKRIFFICRYFNDHMPRCVKFSIILNYATNDGPFSIYE